VAVNVKTRINRNQFNTLENNVKKFILAIGLLISANALAVQPVQVRVPVDSHGMTIEQKNVADRVIQDNKPGSIKHLYVISAYSGQVIIYSTVRGKVTSSGKRLHPMTVAAMDGQYVSSSHAGMPYKGQYTSEVMEDDGTYGSSIPYIYWFDQKGVYHQHYVSGGQIIHVSSEPLPIKSVIINMEVSSKK